MKQSPYADPRMVSVYDRVAVPSQFRPPAQDLVEILQPTVGSLVLDIGTGTGAVARAATGAVGASGRIVGVDASIEMLRVIGKIPTCLVASARVPGLPFRDHLFGAVMAGFVVSHFADYALGLADMARVCRSGGRVGITTWGAMPNPAAGLWSETAAEYLPTEQLDEAFRAHIPWDEWFSSDANVRQALTDAALDSVAVHTREYPIKMTTTEYLLSREASIQGMALRQALSAEDWNGFMRRVADVFRRTCGEHVEYVRDVHFGIGRKPG